jgi:WD40 repeat protein
MNRSYQRGLLRDFSRTLNREAHNLRRWPELLWQQMYNRLNLLGDLYGELERRNKPGCKSWMRLLTMLRESEAISLVLVGHSSKVNCCAISPDGRMAASGGEDENVHIWDTNTGQLLCRMDEITRIRISE